MRAFCWLALLAALPCVAGESDDSISAIREYQRSLGLKPTRNFHKHTGKAHADYRCYYSPKLALPASYDDLRFKKGKAKGCKLDTNRYDVFFYPIEAVATGEQAVTSSLENASPERLTMVVLHEDVHSTHEDSKLPSTATEAASTAMGFIMSDDLAGGKETALFLQKARIVNRYYEDVASLYRSVREKDLEQSEALRNKAELFRSLEKQCRAISPQPTSFDPCPGALNNAGLAFDYTYTKHYPLLYALYEASGRDVRLTVDRIQAVLSKPLRTEQQFVEEVQALMSRASGLSP